MYVQWVATYKYKEPDMKNKLDLYDTNRLKEAVKIVEKVYEYNYTPSSSLSNKLFTILGKLNNIIKDYGEED